MTVYETFKIEYECGCTLTVTYTDVITGQCPRHMEIITKVKRMLWVLDKSD